MSSDLLVNICNDVNAAHSHTAGCSDAGLAAPGVVASAVGVLIWCPDLPDPHCGECRSQHQPGEGAALERVHQLCYSVTNSVSLGNAFTAPVTHPHPLLMRVLHRLVVMLTLVSQVSVVAHFP